MKKRFALLRRKLKSVREEKLPGRAVIFSVAAGLLIAAFFTGMIYTKQELYAQEQTQKHLAQEVFRGVLCPRRPRPHRRGGPDLHPHRRQRRPLRRAVHLHGGDDRGGGHSPPRYEKQPPDPRRDRPGNVHF